MNPNLKFLYQRIKKPNLTKEQAESKVCQEIFIMKVGSSRFMNKRIAFKGGLIIDSLAHGKRGYTKDIDCDLIKYPLSDDGLGSFIEDLNNTNVFTNIRIRIQSAENLRHKNYQGKRILLAFSDGDNEFNLLVDVGVDLMLIKKNKLFNYEIAFGGATSILINPIEIILAEKLSTFAIYGTDNTRAKDLFDAYWIITHYQVDKNTTLKILKTIVVDNSHYFKNIQFTQKFIINTLRDKTFQNNLSTSKRNWTNTSLDIITKTIIDFIM